MGAYCIFLTVFENLRLGIKCILNAMSGVSSFCIFLQGDKNIIKFEGDHNSPRPQFYFDSINIFFHNVLQPPEDEIGEAFFDPMQEYFGKVSEKTTMKLCFKWTVRFQFTTFLEI